MPSQSLSGRHARRRLQMSNIRFHRTHDALLVCRATSGQHCSNGTRLNRITNRSTCTMSLHILDLLRQDPCTLIRLAHHSFLGMLLGTVIPVGVSILGHCGTTDRSVDGIAIGQRTRERFNKHNACTFPTCIAISSGIKCFTASIRREKATFGLSNRHSRRDHGIHPTRKRKRSTRHSRCSDKQDAPQPKNRNKPYPQPCLGHETQTHRRYG